MPLTTDSGPEGRATDPRGVIHDRRVTPRGVLPRHVQMWVMVALAMVILAIILFTGQPQPTPRRQVDPQPLPPSLVPADRVRTYEQALAAEVARQQEALARQADASSLTATTPSRATTRAAVDSMGEEQRRRQYQSLFADNVALSRRPPERPSYADPRRLDLATPTAPGASSATAPASSSDLIGSALQTLLAQKTASSMPRVSPPAAPSPPSSPPVASLPAEESRARTGEGEPSAPPSETGPITSGGAVERLLEGTTIDTVLLNRLDGTLAGPVTCLVTTPVYSHDRQSVVIPAGARVLGAAAPVQTWGDSRLAVSFHRLVMPDGRTHSLDRFKGLGQIGDTGLKDRVDRHYLQVFGASLAIGAVSGLSQFGAHSNVNAYDFGDAYRQGTGSALAASTGRVLDRYLNVLPTITIREGYRIKVYLTNDLQLPVYAATPSGGAR